MSRHVASCRIMSRHFTSCHVMSRHVTSCHVMSHHVTSCHMMYLTRHGTSCHVMSYHVMSRHVTSRHVTSCHILPVVSRHVTSYHVESRGTVTRPTLHCQLTSSTRNQFKLSMTMFVGCPEGCRYNTASAVYSHKQYYCYKCQIINNYFLKLNKRLSGIFVIIVVMIREKNLISLIHLLPLYQISCYKKIIRLLTIYIMLCLFLDFGIMNKLLTYF